MDINSPVDVAVVGLGAAGLGALKALTAARVQAIGIEARPRLGGRAWTAAHAGFPLDLGCGWLHSADRNPLVPVAVALGFDIDRTPPPWGRQSGRQGMSAEEQRDFGKALAATYDRMEKNPADRDPPAATFLDPHSEWNPLIEAISSYFSGAELRDISTRDIQNYQDTEVNWRIERGYGAMIAMIGDGLPIMTDCPVLRIDHRGPEVRLTTPRGELHARKVIVTVPTNVLVEGTLQFDPPLGDKRAAAEHVPLGLANKYTILCTDAEAFPRDGNLFGNARRTETGAYHLRPFGRPLIEVYTGGTFAHQLEADGINAAYDFFVGELTDLIGSGLRQHLRLIAASAWASDPWARGAYSYARPGHADDRTVLAAPVNDTLFFAGEACSKGWFSTAHGAYVTGCDAAAAALKSLGRGIYSAAAISNSSG